MAPVESIPATAEVPRLRWPATVQSLLMMLWVGGFDEYLLRRFGDQPALRMRLLGVGEVVVVSRAEGIREVFTAPRGTLNAGQANSRVIPVLGPSSVLRLDGEEHLRMRKLLLPAFHGDAVREHAARVAETAAREVERWPVGRPFALLPRMQAIALETILDAVIGVRDERRRDRLRELLPDVLAVSPLSFLVEGAYPRLAEGRVGGLRPWVRRRREVERLVRAEIGAHRADPDGRDDVLAALIAARAQDGGALTDAELLDQVFTLLLAGHETTSSSLAWCFERLLRTPAALERLRREIATGDGDEYLGAVVDETLRSRPVVEVIWRKVDEPVRIGRFTLASGTILAGSIRSPQHDDTWEDPEAFRPERFLDGGGAAPYRLIPFGGGSRRCLGASFAVMEMKTVLRAVLERVDLRAPTARPERQSRARRFTTVPARGARAVVTARR